MELLRMCLEELSGKALGEEVGVETGDIQRAGCGLVEPKEVLICV